MCRCVGEEHTAGTKLVSQGSSLASLILHFFPAMPGSPGMEDVGDGYSQS
jgi:hypothetical protein